MDKISEIYKNKINKLKTKVQDTYYYHNNEEETIKNNNEPINKTDLLKKIESIFKRSDYVYQTNINIMYKNGKSIDKTIIGVKDNYLLTMEGERINIDDISDIN